MVALSLYKGNLHKVPDVPRRWPRPTPKISLKEFKILLRRRAKAFARLHTTSNPNHAPPPNSNPNCPISDPDNAENDTDLRNHVDDPSSERDLNEREGEREERHVEAKDPLGILVKEEKNEEIIHHDLKAEAPVSPVVEKISTEDARGDVEKRKNEVKEKLEILNEKKHCLVQVLKQILNAEEQLKRQNSTQSLSSRPPLPLQVDTTTDSGSMTRVNSPRMGSDGNPCGDMEGGEADDVLNHNTHSRHLPRMRSTSPSSDSQQRKPASNMVPHSYQTTLGAAISPSRFAPVGNGPPSVSVGGASYITSSPSPAASGGTSVFRDGRLPSPWN